MLWKMSEKQEEKESRNILAMMSFSGDKLRGAQECPGARYSNHKTFSRKSSFLILSDFPEEYSSNLTEYCNYRSRKDKMVESRLDFLRGKKTPILKDTQIYSMKEEMKLLVIELNLLVKKKSYVCNK